MFRKVSLERLASPDQLDQLVQITTPKGWLALIAIILFLISILTWGWLGRIPTNVSGQGILLATGGVYEVSASHTGRVKGIYCDLGELILKGQLIARIAQPELIDTLNAKKEILNDLNEEYKEVVDYHQQNRQLEVIAELNQQRNLEQAIIIQQERLEWLIEKIINQEQLYKHGLITNEQRVNTKKDFKITEQEIIKLKNQLQELEIKDLKIDNAARDAIRIIEFKITQAKNEINSIQSQLEKATMIISPYSGRVIELVIDSGTFINKGEPVIRLEQVGKHLKNFEATLFFSPANGKNIQRGMIAHISPSTFKPEKFGYMLGLVTGTSKFPTSSEAMMRILHNQVLVQELVSHGAPMIIDATLIPDPDTYSGIKWSTSTGPQAKIHSGTLCTGKITISQEPPINLVIPLFKKYIFGVGDKDH